MTIIACMIYKKNSEEMLIVKHFRKKLVEFPGMLEV